MLAQPRLPHRSLLLDLDGSLIDSNDVHAQAWSDALARFGRRIPASRIRPHIGKGGKELLRDFVTPAEHAILADSMGSVQTEIFLARFGRVKAFPGAGAAVRALHRAGVRVVLATSASPEVVRRATSLLGIDGALAGATTADDVEKTKPFDDVFSLAIRRYGLAALRPMAVGDTPYDLAAAHQIGVPCAALRSGGFPPRTLSRAEWRFDGMADLWRKGRNLFP